MCWAAFIESYQGLHDGWVDCGIGCACLFLASSHVEASPLPSFCCMPFEMAVHKNVLRSEFYIAWIEGTHVPKVNGTAKQ